MQQLHDLVAVAVDADRHDVAGDLALELVRRALGHDPAVVDDREAVAQRVGLLEVVGRQEDGGAGLAQPADLVPHPRPGLRIEAGRRLVEEEQRRPVDHADADVEPAPHAARVRPARSVGRVREVERVEDLLRPGRAAAALLMPNRRPWMISSSRPVDSRYEPPDWAT